VKDIVFVAREIVVEANHLVSVFEKPFAEMGTQESGAAGDKNLLHISLLFLEMQK
jgi:hypothetical protein